MNFSAVRCVSALVVRTSAAHGGNAGAAVLCVYGGPQATLSTRENGSLCVTRQRRACAASRGRAPAVDLRAAWIRAAQCRSTSFHDSIRYPVNPSFRNIGSPGSFIDEISPLLNWTSYRTLVPYQLSPRMPPQLLYLSPRSRCLRFLSLYTHLQRPRYPSSVSASNSFIGSLYLVGVLILGPLCVFTLCA